MKRRFLNIFLILVLLIQVLPIKQLGEQLFNNQWSEEVNASDCACKEMGKSSDTALDFEVVFYNASTQIAATALINFINFQDIIPAHHVFEVPVPPPNC
jgi:hypothetical protein